MPVLHPLVRASDLVDQISTGDDTALPLVQALALVSIAKDLNALRRVLDQLTKDVAPEDRVALRTRVVEIREDL